MIIATLFIAYPLTSRAAVLVTQSPLPMLPAKFLLQHVQQQQGVMTPALQLLGTCLILSSALAATADAEEDEADAEVEVEAGAERRAAAVRGGLKTRGH
jgi:hypothetical protein